MKRFSLALTGAVVLSALLVAGAAAKGPRGGPGPAAAPAEQSDGGQGSCKPTRPTGAVQSGRAIRLHDLGGREVCCFARLARSHMMPWTRIERVHAVQEAGRTCDLL